MWGRHWLEQWLAPNSDSVVPDFPSSNFLSLALLSILTIAREGGLQSSAPAMDTAETCAVCLERECNVAAEGCGHALCVRCALYLCSTCNIPAETSGPPGSIPCPLCRQRIVSFLRLPSSPAKESKVYVSRSMCTPCMVNPRIKGHLSPSCTSEIRMNRVASVSSDMFCPLSCTLFPSLAAPLCTCQSGVCLNFEVEDSERQNHLPSTDAITYHYAHVKVGCALNFEVSNDKTLIILNDNLDL